MLLEMASLEGRGSLCGISRHWGSQGKVDTTPVQTAWREAAEAPVHWVMGNGSLRFWGPLAQMHRFLQDHQPSGKTLWESLMSTGSGKKRPQPGTQWGAMGKLCGVSNSIHWQSYVPPTTLAGELCHHTTEAPSRLAGILARGHSWSRPSPEGGQNSSLGGLGNWS